MIPGPVMLTEEVIQALARPAVSHHDPHYNALLDECIDLLKDIFGTDGLVIILPGSGRLGLEAAITTVVRPGDRTLHLINGFFARWMAEIAKRAGAQTTIVETSWEKPFPADNLREALRRARQRNEPYTLVTATHSETSTGQLNPVSDLGAFCRDYETLFLVDAISSVGCAPLSMEEDRIDLCITASQKGLCAPLGLSVVAIGEPAFEKLSKNKRGTSQSYALDLMGWVTFFASEVPRSYPVIPAPHLVYALHTSLQQIFEEGLSARVARHQRIAAATRQGISALGLECFAAVPSPSVTAVKVPDRLSGSEIIRRLQAKHGIQIASGMGEMADRIVRISHIGVQAMPEPQLRVLRSLADVLNDLGYACNAMAAEDAFHNAYETRRNSESR
jgi:aspartate aminotransferase-like enzyme